MRRDLPGLTAGICPGQVHDLAGALLCMLQATFASERPEDAYAPSKLNQLASSRW